MAEAKNIRLYTPGGERISDPELAADYLTADRTGPFRVGKRRSITATAVLGATASPLTR